MTLVETMVGRLQERKMLIEKCQEVAAAQCLRISFLSGDVHVCAAGRLYSDPKVRFLLALLALLFVGQCACVRN